MAAGWHAMPCARLSTLRDVMSCDFLSQSSLGRVMIMSFMRAKRHGEAFRSFVTGAVDAASALSGGRSLFSRYSSQR
jgi:hypothetical protein